MILIYKDGRTQRRDEIPESCAVVLERRNPFDRATEFEMAVVHPAHGGACEHFGELIESFAVERGTPEEVRDGAIFGLALCPCVGAPRGHAVFG